ncbi:MAG: alpha/beta hydrolase [Gammaproteobacteria bacterium]|nr:alpha/beta hydrolase [Gammaproteobacteria bacterium]MYD75991.1 alpha/beta hydrolase [Gammaproteobacteria bacterium]MYJ52869.1 alpha/beta hydrolase [Gammaproteobacteria bacterium]
MSVDMSWEVPDPLSIHEVTTQDGTTLAVRRHGNSEGPRLVLSHGNGLAIDLYYPFWSLLLDDFDLFVYDIRNHGWNSVGSLGHHHIPSFVNDHDSILAAIGNRYGSKPTTGVFHSISALTTMLSATGSHALAARVLFDPPLCKSNEYPEEFDVAVRQCTERTQRRTEHFDSIEECVDFLRYLPVFSRTVPGVLDLVAKTTLRKRTNGHGYELRCPREFEAQIVNFARAYTVMVNLENLDCPTKVIGADPTLPYSYLPTFDLSQISGVDYDFLPESTHLLQIEQPGECVSAMLEFLDSLDLLNP